MALNRPAHYLRSSASAGIPSRSVALVIDTTTDRTSPTCGERSVRLVGWCASSWEGLGHTERVPPVAVGTDAPALFRYLATLRAGGQSLWVWQLGAAHGLTVLGWWGLLETGQWSIPGLEPVESTEGRSPRSHGICVVEDPPTIILARQAGVGGSVRWLDARNLGLAQWSDLTAAPDIPRRCAALAQWLQQWYCLTEELHLGGVRSTAASQSWHGWRHSYLSSPLLVHNNERAIELDREAHHPGRCEVARLGRSGGRVYQCDASAHYPACASSAPVPTALVRTGSYSLSQCLRCAQHGFRVIARVAVRTRYPCAPVRDGDLTLWPVGRYTTTLCWPEIELLLEYGAQVEVKEAALYAPGRPFGDYFAQLWAVRRAAEAQGQRSRAACVKYLANSLLGKLAAWDWCWNGARGVTPPGPWATWVSYHPLAPRSQIEAALADARAGLGPSGRRLPICRWRSIGWHSQWQHKGGEAHDSLPAIVSWVCSVARCNVWGWCETAGRDHVYYVDTDSVWTDAAGYQALSRAGQISPGEAGALRCVAYHAWVDFRGVKYYLTPDTVVCAGLPRNAELVTDGGWRYWSPERLADSVAHWHEPRPALLRYDVPEQRVYRHGRVGPDGRVFPLELT